MLSYAPIRSADSAADYFARYYAGDAERGDGEPPGQWGGAGAERLGLHGEVSRDDLLAAFRGVAPRTGERLVPEDKRGNIAGNDLTFSAPKSVSAVWAVADAPTRRRIEAAQQRAVDAAMARLTAEAIKARRGQGGQERIGTEPVYASFPHSTSRANDPQLHTHCVVINMGYAADGRWSRVDYDIRATHAAGALYRAALADELRQMGFQIEREPPGRGGRDEGYFRIAGVPDQLIEEWSKRRTRIEEKLSESDAWGAAAASRVSATSREGKENPNRAENFERWRAEAQEHGFGPEAVARLREERGPGREAAGAEREDIQDEEIVRRVFETRAAVRDTDIARAVYSAAVGRESAAEAQARLERVRAQLVPLERTDPRTGRGETYYATPEDVALAERLPQLVDELRASRGHAAEPQAVEAAIAARPTLREEQAQFIRAMARSEGFAVAEGRAGTGKSFALEALREAYERSGYTVRGVAVQGKAAADLQASTGIESSTIARFRQEIDSGAVRLDARTVIVVEEAGMVASRDAAAILAAARAARAKVVMVGDTRQLPPVCAGRPMQDAIRQLGRPDAELVQVVRQREQLDRDIAERFREGRAAEAREMMAREGRWHAVETRADAVHAAARSYAQELAAGGDSLIVASTRRDAYAANLAARAALRKEGALGEREVRFRGHDGRDIRLAEGDRVLFRTNAKQYKNGTIGEVTRVEDGRFEVRVGQGEDARTLTFELPDRERLDRLREAMERPGRPEEVAGRVRAYEREAARQEAAQARLDGIAYGHAVTVHASQGATVRQSAGGVGGNVHIVARDGVGISRELMYVAASRNQASAHVYIRRQEDAAITARAARAAAENTLSGFRRAATGAETGKDTATPRRYDVTASRRHDAATPQRRTIQTRGERDMQVIDTIRQAFRDWRQGRAAPRDEPTTGPAQPSAQQQPQQQARQWSREELAAKLEALRRSSRTASERLGAQTLEGWRGHADHAERWGRQELAEGRQAEGEGLLRYAAEERRLLQEAVEDHIADRRRDMTDRTLSAMRAEAEQARARGDERTAQELERRAGPIATRQDEAARARAVGDLDRADRLERGASEQAARVREEVPAVAERVERGRETDMSSERVREARDWGREPSREACQETSRQAERSADHGHDR